MYGGQSEVNLLVEGPTDEAVAKRVLAHLGLGVGHVYGRQGKRYVVSRLAKYNQAAASARLPWFGLLDLDLKPCGGGYVKEILPCPSQFFCLRIAQRALEAWLLADADAVARFLGVSQAVVLKVAGKPDWVTNPKVTLIQLATRSPGKGLRFDMVPRSGSGAVVGPGYEGRIREFTAEYWRPEVAAITSDSLRRALAALDRLKAVAENC